MTEQDLAARPDYDYSETDLEPDGSRNTFAVHMLSGSPYSELVAVNGRPLSPGQREQEKRKLKEEISRRQQESPADRAKRLEEFAKEQKRDQRFVEEFAQAFNFKLNGERMVGQRRVYVIEATPDPRFHPTDKESEVLTGMQGILWIDSASYHWVRAEAKVIHPVSIEGFLAKVEPGTRFLLEKTPVGNGIWLTSHYSMNAEAKILSFIPHRRHEDERYFNYHPTVDAEASNSKQ